jgi:hypothetical protein
MLLLDTHAWYWLVDGNPRLAEGTRRTIDRAAARGELLVSVISAWEMVTLESKARVAFDIPLPGLDPAGSGVAASARPDYARSRRRKHAAARAFPS